MKGIILAGGNGTRLQPLTKSINKHLLPVYDKPMIFYPLATLMNLEIKDILIICKKSDIELFKQCLGDGTDYGISIQYAIQEKANGIAESFIIAEDFIRDNNVTLILGDNIFYGAEISKEFLSNKCVFEKGKECAYIFSYNVSDPERFGIVEIGETGEVVSIEEKPKNPKSHLAITGIYMYDKSVIEKAKSLKPSKREELEITDLNNLYLNNNTLKNIRFKRGFSWIDVGTTDSIIEASMFIQNIEKRQGLKISCLEEMALNKGFIDEKKFEKVIQKYDKKSDYYKYLKNLI